MTPAPATDTMPRATRVQRLRVGLLEVARWLANRLPASVVGGAADAFGELWYRATPARAAQARANLGRVVAHLAAAGAGSALDPFGTHRHQAGDETEVSGTTQMLRNRTGLP